MRFSKRRRESELKGGKHCHLLNLMNDRVQDQTSSIINTWKSLAENNQFQTVLRDVDVLKNHLRFMCNNSRFSWFDIFEAVETNPKRKMVRSKQEWSEYLIGKQLVTGDYLDIDISYFGKTNNVYHSPQPFYQDGRLIWIFPSPKGMIDIQQIKNLKVEYNHEKIRELNTIFKKINDIGSKGIQLICNHYGTRNWTEKLSLDYIQRWLTKGQLIFYEDFIRDVITYCLLYSVQDKQEGSFKISKYIFHKGYYSVSLYILICNLVSNLPEFIQYIYDVSFDDEKKLKIRKELMRSKSLAERKHKAKHRGMEIQKEKDKQELEIEKEKIAQELVDSMDEFTKPDQDYGEGFETIEMD